MKLDVTLLQQKFIRNLFLFLEIKTGEFKCHTKWLLRFKNEATNNSYKLRSEGSNSDMEE